MRPERRYSEGLRLDELARELPIGSGIIGDPQVRVFGVHQDSRLVQTGDLFVARPGRTFDGARFIDDAVARGAAAVMATPGAVAAKLSVPWIRVDDPGYALPYAASAIYGHPSHALDVIGVTGTNGKTTTIHLVRAAVDAALGRSSSGVLGTIGASFGDWSANAQHTTPEADEIARAMAAMRSRGATHIAMEVSSHALALDRVRSVRFRVAALTNLTQDHLDFHGSMRSYAEAKARLFTELRPAAAVLNVDDPFGRELAGRAGGTVVRVSARRITDADIMLRDSHMDASGIRARVLTPRGDVFIASCLVGTHNLENLLLALGVAHALELDLERAVAGLSREPGARGRLERCDSAADDLAVLVDYAHTPDALTRVLDAVRSVTKGRIWCVFGCGGDRDPRKRGPMGEVVGMRADIAVVTSDNPRTEDPRMIAEAIVEGVRRVGQDPLVELDRRKAIELAVRSASSGDLVLVAGKGHEDYQVVGDVKYPFDDRIEAGRALQARRRARGAT